MTTSSDARNGGSKTGRINARLTGEQARKLALLQARTRKSASELISESIDKLYASYLSPAEGPSAIFAQIGFLGCAEGPADLSANYKRELTRSWGKKA